MSRKSVGIESIVLFAALAAAGSGLARAATLTVTTAADVVDVGDGVLSLREAIDDAQPGDTVVFDGSLLGQTIVLTLGTLTIDTDLTVDGPGASLLTLDGNDDGRVLFIDTGASVVLRGLTITGGSFGGAGGGIRHDGLDLTVDDCVITGNSSGWAGAGIANFFGFSLTVTDSRIDGNDGAIGGGLFVNAGTVTVTDTSIRDNVGGGIWNLAGEMTVTGSTIAGNVVESSDGGSGVLTSSGTSTLVNTTVSDNESTGLFGGFGSGGGLKVLFGTVRLFNSTVVDNSAVTDGGGLAVTESTAVLEMTNSIVLGNTAPSGVDCAAASGGLSSLGYNLVGDLTGCPSDGPGDLSVDSQSVFTAVLGPLADNGGPTVTHDLLGGSPALDGGDPAGCLGPDGVVLATDQRGVGRPIGPACDAGAVESSASPDGPLGGTAVGLDVSRVICRNVSTGQEVVLSGADSWDCSAAGLVSSPGDRLGQLVEGTAVGEGGGGSAVGVSDAQLRVRCSNVTTGQTLELLLTGETSYDCAAAGLAVSPSDRLRFITLGVVP